MINNDVMRRIRYIFDFNDSKMIAIFGQADCEITEEALGNWLKKEDEPEFQKLADIQLATFMNGLINDRRGKKEGAQPEPEKQINNNIIFRKLKIALDLKAEDVLDILALAEVSISKRELSAFFRKPGHKHFRECSDQVLGKFLEGMQLKYHTAKS